MTDPAAAAVRRISPADAGALADRIVAAVVACPGVARLAQGPLATYLPGRAVHGVAINGRSVEIAVVARHGTSLAEVAGQIRAAVAGIVVGVPIDVTIADLETPEPAELPDGS